MESKTISAWDRLVENPSEGYKQDFIEEERFLKEKISKDDIVLDLGCGTGRTIKIIFPISKKVIGIDNDPDAISVGKENIKDLTNAEIHLEDAEKTQFNDDSFDVVFIGGTFVNFGDTKTKILKEIKRILKDNGKLIFTVYNEDSTEERSEMYKKLGIEDFVIDNEKNIRFEFAISETFSKEKITKILENAGFEVESIKKGKVFYFIEAIN